MRIVTLAALVCCIPFSAVTAAADRWTPLSYRTAEYESWSIDRTTIARRGANVSMWVRARNASRCIPGSNSEDCFAEIVKDMEFRQQYLFHCGDRTYVVMAAYRYSASGSLNGGGPAPRDRVEVKPAVPGTIEEYLYTLACAKVAPGTKPPVRKQSM